MRVFANSFLVAFAVDALLRIAASAAGLSWLSGLAASFSGLLMIASLPIFVLMGIRPGLRWRVFLPPCLFLTWLSLGAMPLPIWFGGSDAWLVAGGVQAAFAGTAFALCRQLNGGERWLLDEESLRGSSFSGRTALGFTTLNLLVILPASFAYLAFSAAAGIGHLTRGFVDVRGDGIHLSHREYVRDEQTIHLVAMMHIGESTFYEELADALPRHRAVILTEGVTDEARLLPEGLSYGNVAGGLGLVEQPAFGSDEPERDPADTDLGSAQVEMRHADVDTSEFSPETLAFLKSTGRIWSAETPLQALLAYTELINGMSSETAVRITGVLTHDLIELRNDHLLVELEASLLDYDTVVVPWGALHLPGIQDRVRELGFVQDASTERRVIRW